MRPMDLSIGLFLIKRDIGFPTLRTFTTFKTLSTLRTLRKFEKSYIE